MIPADQRVLQTLQSRVVTQDEFDFDHLYARPLYSLLTQYDIDRLNNIATSNRYAGNARKKFNAISEIMHARGFRKLSSGTNRIAYSYFEDPSIVVKVAADKTAIHDNPREFCNQKFLKPFCTKVFEVSPDGTVGLFERVRPITSREEFSTCAEDVFLLLDLITEKYILADIGTKYFMNYGIRERNNFGPVLLDFPYLYEPDGNKLVCHKQDPESPMGFCGGLIDYDPGYNSLYCTKCGARYRAVELGKYLAKNQIVRKGSKKMSLRVGYSWNGKKYTNSEPGNDNVMQNASPVIETQTKKSEETHGGLKVTYRKGNKVAPVVTPEKIEENEKLANANGRKLRAKGKYNNKNKSYNNDRRKNDYRDRRSDNRNNSQGSRNSHIERKGNIYDKKTISYDDIKEKKFEFSSFDAENGLIFFKSGGITISIPTKEVPQDVIDTLVPTVEVDENVVTELEQAKADISVAKDTIDDLKKTVAELTELKKAQQETIDNYASSAQAEADSYEELQRKYDELKEDRDSLGKDYDKLANENETYANEVEKLKKELESVSNVEDEKASDDSLFEEEDEYDEYIPPVGFTKLSGTMHVLGDLAQSLQLTVDDESKDDKVIAFRIDPEDPASGYYIDGDNKVIVVDTINNNNVNDIKIVKSSSN